MPASKMLREIGQQPEVLERTIASELATAEKIRQRFAKRKPRLIVLVARGTSDNAAQFGRYLLEITTGIPVSLAAPSVYTLYKSAMDLKDILLVAISQSGESTDINVVVKQAAAQGAFTLGITNQQTSELARLVDTVFLVRAGTEESVAATKTYTGQLLTFYLLAYALGGSIRVDDLRRLPQCASAALQLQPEIAAQAVRYRFMERAVVVARGLNYANAFEFALKLMETCYVVAERFSSADFLHGPIAMLEASFPVFMFAPPGVTWKGLAGLASQLQEIGAETLIITDQSHRAAVKRAASGRLNHSFVIPLEIESRDRPADLYTPIPYIIPAQLLAVSLAEVKGLDPDCPRALSKITRTL
jgi:glucosamine--fructose-6-phosphate aminotransferase (isomerizing)